MEFGLYIRWGNGFRLLNQGRTQEALGTIGHGHWVVKGSRVKLGHFITPEELERNFEIVIKPEERS